MSTRHDSAREKARRATNEDPISGEPGAHPVGTGAGAAIGGAVAGAAAGAIGGPIGAAAGVIVGGVAGGLGGKAVAEQIDPTVETTYWRTQYPNASYYDKQLDFAAMEPAYRYGWESRTVHGHRSFEEMEPELERDWRSQSGAVRLPWLQARPAARDAWNRIDKR